jgi:LmbE family N-acetylglucosaminyl deacetylase
MENWYIPYTAIKTLPQGNVLIIAPHPDDEIFGCGGAISQYLAQNQSVQVLILTDGSAAEAHSDEDSRLLYVATRQQESNHAAQIIGYGRPEFWEFTDRELPQEEWLIERLYQYLIRHHINQVYAPSTLEIHPDHIAAAHLAVEAVKRCGQTVTLCMYEIGMPIRPNRLLDITAHLGRKQHAIYAFHSQLKLHNYCDFILGLNQYRAYTLPSSVRAAEAYYAINGEELRHHPVQEFGQSPVTFALEQAQQKIAELEKQLSEKQTELNRIYQSYSWQITEPFRWLKQKFYRSF